MGDTEMTEDLDKSFDENTAPDDADYNPQQKKTRKQNRPKVADTWTDENIGKLIAEVETRPCIWNAGDPDYKMRNKREVAWREISEAFDDGVRPVDQLTAKWQSLRTQYRSSVATAKRTKSGQGASKKPHWKFHSQMAFVDAAEQSQRVRTESNLSLDLDAQSDLTGVTDATLTDGNSVASGSSGVGVRKKTSAKDANNSEKEEVILAGIKTAMDRLHQPKKTPDELQTFGNYLVSDLRRIKSVEYLKEVQQQLLKLAWDLIDKQPV